MTSVGQNNSFSKIALSLRFSNGTYMCSPVLDVISLPQAGLPYLSYLSIFLPAQGFPFPSLHLISPFLLSSKCFLAMICFFFLYCSFYLYECEINENISLSHFFTSVPPGGEIIPHSVLFAIIYLLTE